jgi:hypothetical protein
MPDYSGWAEIFLRAPSREWGWGSSSEGLVKLGSWGFRDLKLDRLQFFSEWMLDAVSGPSFFLSKTVKW